MAPATVSVSPPPATQKTVGRVLIIDDMDATRQRLAQLLTRHGYKALPVPGAREAFDVLQQITVDAILLDLVMPRVNGWEFRELQLSNRRLALIPTIVVTVKALADADLYALRLEKAAVVQKPFEDQQVLAAVARAHDFAAVGPETPVWRTSDGQSLFWSRHGHVACVDHAPSIDSERWRRESWTPIPANAGKSRVEYACQQCGGGPIKRRPADVNA